MNITVDEKLNEVLKAFDKEMNLFVDSLRQDIMKVWNEREGDHDQQMNDLVERVQNSVR